MAKRSFPESLIPPGINDERSRSLLKAFEAMANEFDFSRLLMRNSSEIEDEALSLAVHDFSLDEFIGDDGLPAPLVRKLIDRAWELHELQGLDAGVELAQSLFGIRADIRHWWQEEPRGHHDTHTITLSLGDGDEPPGVPLGPEVQKTALRTIDVTKRYSQGSSIIWKAAARGHVRISGFINDHAKTSLLPPLTTSLKSRLPVAPVASMATGQKAIVRPELTSELTIPMTLARSGVVSAGQVDQVRPVLPSSLPVTITLGRGGAVSTGQTDQIRPLIPSTLPIPIRLGRGGAVSTGCIDAVRPFAPTAVAGDVTVQTAIQIRPIRQIMKVMPHA